MRNYPKYYTSELEHMLYKDLTDKYPNIAIKDTLELASQLIDTKKHLAPSKLHIRTNTLLLLKAVYKEAVAICDWEVLKVNKKAIHDAKRTVKRLKGLPTPTRFEVLLLGLRNIL